MLPLPRSERALVVGRRPNTVVALPRASSSVDAAAPSFGAWDAQLQRALERIEVRAARAAEAQQARQARRFVG